MRNYVTFSERMKEKIERKEGIRNGSSAMKEGSRRGEGKIEDDERNERRDSTMER